MNKPVLAETVVVPSAAGVASPALPAELLIVAAVGSLEFQLTEVVKSCWLASLKVPMARNCSAVVNGIEPLAGSTRIETNAGLYTVSSVESLSDPTVAEIVVVPSARAVAKPWLPAALLIVATAGLLLPHVAVRVRSCLLPSVKLPVEVNCSVFATAIEGWTGVRAIETNVGGVTVNVVEPLIEPKLALIVVMPGSDVLASPWLLMVATAVLEEFQLTKVVRSCVLPSVKVPVALNCCFVPSGMETVGGVMVRNTKTGGVTVRIVEPLTEPKEAVIAVVPWARLVASPWLLMVATGVLEEFQLTALVRFRVLPSVKVPVALNCCFVPSRMEGLPGVTARDAKTGGVTVRVVEPLTVPKEAAIAVVPWARLVVSPWLLMVAAAVLEEFQLTEVVRS